jgi:hypothetical protein
LSAIKGLIYTRLDQENINIRIHRDITGEMWFGVDKVDEL